MASEGVCIVREAVPRDQSVHSPQQPQETKAPKDMPPEAVKENMDVKDGPAPPAMGEPSGEKEEDRMESQQEEHAFYLDPDMLRYIDKLFFQEDLVNKVEEVIQSRFVAQLLSSETQLDLVALAKELLELEEGLALVWLLEKLHLAEEEEEEEEEDEQAPQSDGALQPDPSPSEPVASQGAQGDDHGPQLGVNAKACPPDDFKDGQSPGHADAQLARPQALVDPSGCQECPPLGALGPPSAPQGLKHTDSGLGPRDAAIPRQTSPVRGGRKPVDKSSEKEENLPDLVLALASPKSLSPSALSLNPVPASGLACPGGRGARKAAQSQPPKRKSEQSVAGRGRKRKRYSSQRGAGEGPSRPESGGPH